VYDDLSRMHSTHPPASARMHFKPDAIVGDLDSIRSDVRAFYHGIDVEMVDLGHDQETTDLEKCIAFVEKAMERESASIRKQKVGQAGKVGDRDLIAVVGALLRETYIQL
jgi:thiamine pyrophosphokinase